MPCHFTAAELAVIEAALSRDLRYQGAVSHRSLAALLERVRAYLQAKEGEGNEL